MSIQNSCVAVLISILFLSLNPASPDNKKTPTERRLLQRIDYMENGKPNDKRLAFIATYCDKDSRPDFSKGISLIICSSNGNRFVCYPKHLILECKIGEDEWQVVTVVRKDEQQLTQEAIELELEKEELAAVGKKLRTAMESGKILDTNNPIRINLGSTVTKY